MVASGGHPDVHRLGPEGPGRQVVIGGAGSRTRGIRDLIAELAYLPVEGGARIAIIESAQRMNEDAQAALLKTLEEPPAGVTLVLCADAEEPLLPTIRSRCARIRLGPVGPRAIEEILASHGITDAPLAARLARIASGRPGMALAWAGEPDALRARDELVRVLLDLITARPSDRLAAIRSGTATAATIAGLSERADPSRPAEGVTATGGRGRRAATNAVVPTPPADDPATSAMGPGGAGDDAGAGGDAGAGDAVDVEGLAPARASATQRRRAAEALVSVWAELTRDLALTARGLEGSLRDPRPLEELRATAATVDVDALTAFLDRLGRASVLLAGNVAPELVLDDLALAWPTRRRAAA